MNKLFIIIPLAIFGAISGFLNYKFMINKKLWNLVKIKKTWHGLLFISSYILLGLLLQEIILNLLSNNMIVTDNIKKIVQGSVMGLFLLLIPYEEPKKLKK